MIDDVGDKAGQVILGQAISQAYGHLQGCLTVCGYKLSAHAHECDTFSTKWRGVLSDKLLAVYKMCQDYFQKNSLPPPAEMTRMLQGLQAGTLATAQQAAVTAEEAVSTAPERRVNFEPIGGAVPLDSAYYI